LHNIGCLGKIISFKETEDGRNVIELKGLIRFEIIKEIKSLKKYREYQINFKKFSHDLNEEKRKS
jgi:Lon protease-like protein